MAGYLKLPPYGRALLDQRELGHHPSRIYVWYGDRWWERPKDAPCLCVGLDYTHGQYDWRVVAGVPVDLVWHGGRRIRRLVAEIAAHSPLLVVHTPRTRVHADTFLASYRQRRRHPLWSAEAERDYLGRMQQYYDAMLADLQLEASHGR